MDVFKNPIVASENEINFNINLCRFQLVSVLLGHDFKHITFQVAN